MEAKTNIAEILKGKPQGTKLIEREEENERA